MQIVIPMSGEGLRFRRAGYADPKPLIKVDGVPMIERVVALFPGETDFLFICSAAHLEQTPLQSVLERIAPRGRVVSIEPHKRGPVHAVLRAAEYLRDSEPVVVNYCDFGMGWDYKHFCRQVRETGCAGSLAAYRGFHPHSLGPNLYAYIRDENQFLIEIQEKRCFTDKRMDEYASTGTYYFRSGALLKRYFHEAVRRGLQTNGEFYASMPYNLMAEDGLQVYIYEVARFLQWGTPEDLQEYQRWSDYFAYFTEWTPQRPASAGTTLIPMAGEGIRFVREGYHDPKPAIRVAGIPMIERVLTALPPYTRVVAVCQASQIGRSSLEGALRRACPNCELVSLDHATEGQASTCLEARGRIDLEEPLLIASCDARAIYDEDDWYRLIASSDTDCAVWTFRNHPHANRNPHQYGWAEANHDGQILRISCKQPIHQAADRDLGIIGTFWFRKARYFFEAAEELLRRNLRVNNEFYVDSVAQILLEQRRSLRVFPVEHYICLGTPDDVRTYEYWERHFREDRSHPYGKRAEVHVRPIDPAFTRLAGL